MKVETWLLGTIHLEEFQEESAVLVDMSELVSVLVVLEVI